MFLRFNAVFFNLWKFMPSKQCRINLDFLIWQIIETYSIIRTFYHLICQPGIRNKVNLFRNSFLCIYVLDVMILSKNMSPISIFPRINFPTIFSHPQNQGHREVFPGTRIRREKRKILIAFFFLLLLLLLW